MLLKGLKSSKLNLSLKNRILKQIVFTKFKWFRVSKNFYEIIQDPIGFEKCYLSVLFVLGRVAWMACLREWRGRGASVNGVSVEAPT